MTPHGVNAKDLVGLPRAVGAWTACAKSGFREKPSPTNATVMIRFDDSGRYRGATCSGCGALAACVQSSTQGTVSMQNKSGDVTGEPSFDVAVTFTCD